MSPPGDKDATKEKGPPARLLKLRELDKKLGLLNEVCEDSAIHACVSLLRVAHQRTIDLRPSIKVLFEEETFKDIQHSVTLVNHISRDITNLAYSRYGREKHGLKDCSVFARKTAKQCCVYSVKLRDHINTMMADAIALGV